MRRAWCLPGVEVALLCLSLPVVGAAGADALRAGLRGGDPLAPAALAAGLAIASAAALWRARPGRAR